jgi:hypothetical protein
VKKFITPLVLTSLIVGCANVSTPPSHADRSVADERGRFKGRYDGPDFGIDRRELDRQPRPSAYCERYRSETARHVLACNYGVEEAQQMAEKYAGGYGREEGYLRGYTWGLNKMVRFYENDPEEISHGERMVESYSAHFTSAANEGGAVGTRDGESLGSGEAKGRFFSAINTGVMPTTNYNIPANSYQGVTGASQRFLGGIPSAEDILKDTRYGRLSIYQTYDRDYIHFGDHREYHTRDVWTRDGVYHHNQKRHLNSRDALEIWLKLPSRSKNKYNLLNDKTAFMKMEKSERLPAQERPGRPGEGRPGPGTPGPVNPPVVVDYKAIFREAFEDAYANYAHHAYNRAFHNNVDNGQRDGEAVGADVGSQIAQRKGLARAFDRKYNDVSRQVYTTSFANAYTRGFSTTYNYYKDNSILTLDFMDIQGRDEDGIIQPGEEFGVQFKVVNVGGKPADLKYTVSGNVENVQQHTSAIEAISSKTITSEPIGFIDSRLDSDEQASVILDVNKIQEKLWKKIKRPIEIAELNSSLSTLEGSGLYTVVVKNVSTVTTNGAISLELKLNGKVVKTVFGEALMAGEKKSFALDFSGVDPLSWIKGSIKAEILLKYNTAIYAQKSFDLTEKGSIDMFANYYDRLINGKGVVPKGKDAEERANEVRAVLVAKNAEEVAYQRGNNGNVYRTNPEITIPGKIAIVKEGRGNQSTSALKAYSNLADTMNKEAKNFKSILGIHPKRSSYQGILSRIAGRKIK